MISDLKSKSEPADNLKEDFHRFFEAIVESSDDAILSKDLNGTIRSWNSAAEIVGQPITLLIPEGHLDDEPRILGRIRQGQKVEHYETVRKRKDGTLINVSLTVTPIKDAQGNVIGASKIARDITAQRRAEEVQLHFAAIVESSDDAILSKDLNGIIRSWNRAAEKIFGYTADEIIGQSVTRLIPKGHDDEEPHILARIRRGEKIDHYETIRQRKDGELLNISLTVSPIKDRTGKIIGASKIARDITGQKRAEEAVRSAREDLAALNRELENRVEQRTKSLNEAVAQMEEFSYSVSHDLRSPARAMRAYGEVLLEDYGARLDDKGRDYLNRIILGSTRMDKLIVDLLTYSKVARAKLDIQPVSLKPVIQEIIQHYPEMQPPKAQITLHGDFPKVMAHEPSLIQAVSNLLSNAVKFVTPGVTPQVEVRAAREGDKVRLTITDNGIGILPEHQSRLFGMFERANHDSRYEGTGIGLAIVRKAIERMGGQVGRQADTVAGSLFWIELPAVPA